MSIKHVVTSEDFHDLTIECDEEDPFSIEISQPNGSYAGASIEGVSVAVDQLDELIQILQEIKEHYTHG